MADIGPIAAVERALAYAWSGEPNQAAGVLSAALPDLRRDHEEAMQLHYIGGMLGCADVGEEEEAIKRLRASASEYRALLQDALTALESAHFIARDNLAARIRAALQRP